MEIIYIISVLILLISFIVLKKSEKAINIISFMCISIVTLFCYNTFICYILTFFTIPIKLWILTLINILISMLFLFFIVKRKKIQIYIFRKIDLLNIIIILLVCIIITYINFGFPFDIKYEMGGDSATHFLASTMFAESDHLLASNSKIDQVFGGLKNFKPMSYVNSGLLMKSICPNAGSFEYYNIFVLFGVFILFLTGSTMYATLLSLKKEKEHNIWAIIIALICMLGYPLNSFLFGFEYLSMGILMLCAILCFINYVDNDIINSKCFVIIMTLFNFGLFLSYYMFSVYVYPAQWIYFCVRNYCRTKKIITKELILILTITLIIPFILGYIYTLEPSIYSILIEDSISVEEIFKNSAYIVDSGFKFVGYIYVNFYSNILLLLPLPIYKFIKDIRDRELKKNIH